MLAISLQSGSNGNCIYVEAGGVRLLFDAGISGKRAQERLAERGRDVRSVDAVVISHDHADHTRSMGIYQRKFGLPVYVTAHTFEAARAKYPLGRIDDARHFKAGTTLQFGDVSVETVPTPHDGADGVVFIVDDGRHRLGVLTDLGHVFGGLDELIRSLDAVFLESNYDPQMLADGPYPPFLKRRIRGPQGHISNVEAAELLHAAASTRMQWACLAHLSEQNNTPDLALGTHREILSDGLPVHLASRYEATAPLAIRNPARA
jgi:phosphoribosyl 1,2-cyclic phosphodiesterase